MIEVLTFVPSWSVVVDGEGDVDVVNAVEIVVDDVDVNVELVNDINSDNDVEDDVDDDVVVVCGLPPTALPTPSLTLSTSLSSDMSSRLLSALLLLRDTSVSDLPRVASNIWYGASDASKACLKDS